MCFDTYSDRFSRYIDMVYELRCENELLRKEIPTNFINVNDKLPGEGQECIVIGREYRGSESGKMGISIFTANSGWEGQLLFVTHWQPISQTIKTLVKSANRKS